MEYNLVLGCKLKEKLEKKKKNHSAEATKPRDAEPDTAIVIVGGKAFTIHHYTVHSSSHTFILHMWHATFAPATNTTLAYVHM